MKRVDSEFKNRVYTYVSQIPVGKVATYGQIAALAGAPWAAWEVGQIANKGPENLPWHRVVNKQGGLARGWPAGGLEGHKQALLSEGVDVDENYKVNIKELQWQIDQ